MTTMSRADRRTAVAAAAPSTFEDFYRAQYRGVVGLVYSVAVDWAVAEEITQEAFVRAYVRWSRLGDHPRPDLWVRRVALNLSTSVFRRRQSERRATARTGARQVAEQRSAPTPHDGDDDWLLEHVRRLPRRQAHAVVLVHVEHLDHDEAAEVLGCRPSTLRTHLQRARTTLQRALSEEHGDD